MDARFDYVKCIARLHAENAATMAELWTNSFEPDYVSSPDPHCAKVSVVRHLPDGRNLMSFEAWGVKSNFVLNLDWRIWGQYLVRVDARSDATIARDGVDRMYQHLRNNKAGNRNVQLFDSRARSKRAGRDTGGYGIAIGSHKSDLRITMYVRGHEAGAMEFQIQGEKLKRIVKVLNSYPQDNDVTTQDAQWLALLVSVVAEGSASLAEMTGLDYNAVKDLLADSLMVEDEIEATLTSIDALIDLLPLEAIHGVLRSVQMRLF